MAGIVELVFTGTDRGASQVAFKVSGSVKDLAKEQRDLVRAAQQAAVGQKDFARALSLAEHELAQTTKNTREYYEAQARLKTIQDQATASMRTQGGGLESLAKKAMVAYGAVQTLSTGWDMAKQGAGLRQVEASFGSLAQNTGRNAQQYLAALKSMSQGTISDAELMRSANSAMVSSNQQLAANLPQLLNIARRSAQATGADVGQMFNDLVEGIKKGETEILDNLGLTINLTNVYAEYGKKLGVSGQALTQAQKDQALMNEVLRQGEQQMKKLGDATDPVALKFQQLDTTLTNGFNRIKTGATGLVAAISDKWQALFDLDLKRLAVGDVDTTAGPLRDAMAGVADAVATTTAALETHAGATNASASAQLQATTAAQQQAQANQHLAAATGETTTQQQMALSVTQQQEQATRDLAIAQGEATQKSLEQQIADQQLSDAQADLARVTSMIGQETEAGSGIKYSAADAAAFLKAKYGELGVQIAALIGLQQKLNAVMAQGGQGNTLMGRDAARTDSGASQAIDYAKALREQQLAMETDAQTAARLRKEMAGLDKDTALYIRKQTELMQLEKKKAGGGGGVGGRGGKSETDKRIEDQRRAAEQLIKIEQDTTKRIEEINQQAARRMADIDRQRNQERWQAEKDFARKLDSTAKQSAAESGMNNLELAGTEGEERAGLEAREKIEAEQHQRTLENQTKAYEDSQQVSVEYAQRAHEIREQQNDQQTQLDLDYQQRKRELEADGNAKGLAELDQLYAAQKVRIEEAAAGELAIALQQESDRKESAQREKEKVIADAEEQKAETIKRAQEQAQGVKDATADMQAGTASSLDAAGGKWTNYADKVKEQTDRIKAYAAEAQRAAAGLGPGSGGTENPAGVPQFASGTSSAPGGGAIIHVGELLRKGGQTGYVAQGGYANLSRGTEVVPASRVAAESAPPQGNNYFDLRGTNYSDSHIKALFRQALAEHDRAQSGQQRMATLRRG